MTKEAQTEYMTDPQLFDYFGLNHAKSYRGKKIIKTLCNKANGFEKRGQTGSHVKLYLKNQIVVVPMHANKAIDKGLFHSILEDANDVIQSNVITPSTSTFLIQRLGHVLFFNHRI